MRGNAKVALLLLGLLAGAVLGYLTRPSATEIKIGGSSIEFSDTKSAAGASDSLTTGQIQHVALYAVIGGVMGLLAGFAADRR